MLGLDNIVAILFAVVIFVVVFQVCSLLTAPIFVKITLFKLPLHRKSTIIWLEAVLLVGSFIYFAAFSLYENSLWWVVAIWILLSPLLARLIATRQKKISI